MAIDLGSIQEQNIQTGLPSIKVFGIGGGGGNVVNRMMADSVTGVEYVVANTDAMVLNSSRAPIKLSLGKKGLGAGMKPEVGRMSAEEEEEKIKEVLEGTDMVFIAAGMGGGTGTGAAPVVAEIAKEMKILTVGVVTTPFSFEGRKRAKLAESGILEIKKHVDTLMVIPNKKLMDIVSQQTTMDEAFAIADDVLKQAIGGITNLINLEGIINLDFADVRTVMQNKGRAIMGTGVASGEKRGLEAAKKAISSPLLSDKQISGATGVIINIVADPNFSLMDAEAAAEFIEESADQDADVIFGFVRDETKADEVAITVIATGFEKLLDEQEEETAPRQGPTLRVVDSVRKQTERNVQPEPSEREEASQPETVASPEEVLELNAEFLTRVEDTLHVPPHLRNAETGPGPSARKERVDYDIPTFIRQSRGIK